MFVFFFFKQKTAYEMRISDWSSDVCSSDLGASSLPIRHGATGLAAFRGRRPCAPCASGASRQSCGYDGAGAGAGAAASPSPFPLHAERRSAAGGHARLRSEEHTSELQSLMRISYAVFCLKKKKNKQKQTLSSSRITHTHR